MLSPNKFFCFFTRGPYEALARECCASFWRHGLRVNSIAIPADGTWMHRCKSRALRLREMADIYSDCGIGLLDADLQCLKPPSDLLRCDWGDVAIHDLCDIGLAPDDRCKRFSAGVIVFAPTENGRRCLKRWADLCEADPEPFIELREQVYLHTAITECEKSGLKVFNLGDRYNRVPERMKDRDDTVILHRVASRELRTVSGGGL